MRIKGCSIAKVTFKFIAPKAKMVSVAGDFNDWNIVTHPLKRIQDGVADGMWQITLSLAPGVYEYCFVVDGFLWSDMLRDEFHANGSGDNKHAILCCYSVQERKESRQAQC
jgi:1,4-alpha-glucan branching enzyme